MCKTSRAVSYLAGIVLLTFGLSHGRFLVGQTLGDVARQQREKLQAKKDQAAAKVITNEDLPEHADDDGDDSDRSAPHRTKEPRHVTSKSAEQWRAQILAQKKNVENLERQMNALSGTIHYVESNAYYNGVQHNLRQEQKQLQVERMQQQLAEQKEKLEQMQESARKDGFGNGVYDP